MAKEKRPIIEINKRRFLRLPIKTHIITPEDDIAVVVNEYTAQKRQPDDIIVVSESVVAISQGRAIPEEQIKVGLLARILWRFVRKVPYGIGLRSPTSMQCAINECGALRILLAALVGGVGKLLGRRGDFYRIAGKQAATIDAAHTSPIEPYSKCVILGPKDPQRVAQRIKELTHCESAIMDINDIGGSWVLGATPGVDKHLLQDIMRDNPMGQKTEQTPICIVREIKE
ncbi:coenzyme F420-0:L-glutamate ligase [Candidatus Sumerlaeota bacterium]|nr:coenzyme F420-0:L-glutamate ligase [Candidatus Sumerlaeota bacterium]